MSNALAAPPEAVAATPTAAPPVPRRRLLVFLFAETGAGHQASARAVAGEVEARHGESFAVRLLDPFAEAAPWVVHRAVSLYNPLIRHAPWAWGLGYRLTDNRPGMRLLRGAFLRLVEPGLEAALERLRPAAVVSFHPLLNHPSAAVRARLGPPRPRLVTVVTDLVDVHAAWTAQGVDAVVTASPSGLDHCRHAGIPGERCFDLGLPVDAAFTREPPDPVERAALRSALGLEAAPFTVLLTGGGEGSGGLRRRVESLLGARVDAQLVVVCGRNRRLVEQLGSVSAAPPTRLHVEGFVANMAQWMRAADVVVSKAGPGTIAEALCSGTPLLLTAYVPGQERGNVGYVVATGAGRWVPRPADLVDAVRELAQPGSAALETMRRALGHAARPAAAAEIADLVCDLVGSGVEP